VGENTVQAVVLTPDEGIMAVPELRITFTLRDRNIGPIDAKLIDRKRYWEGENLRLPLPGTWTMRVTVRVSDFDQVTASKAVEIGEDARSS
jgi:copper transport protein